MTIHYSLDEETRVWRREDHAAFAYSDGDEHEGYLRQVIASATDLSSYSPELIAAIRDFASEYHLSPVRHNLLRPFGFGASDSVIELGAGCGAMTRYLGERCGRVVSVEGSPRRAGIAASRCRDLPNVALYCDSILTFRTDETFDYVLLVGVLEYATKYGYGPHPVIDLLQQARSLLKPGGQVVIAIENKLGLKYFAGCAEDHHGIPFLGVSDLYVAGDTTTYGRRELAGLLAASGLDAQQFYYPFPDYKLPTALLTDAALADPQLNVGDLLLTTPSRDYWDDRFRTFDEGLAQRALHRNGLLADLANSFLVFAGPAPAPSDETWLCKLYNRSLRKPELAVETTMARDAEGIVVQKAPLTSGDRTIAGQHYPGTSRYIQGHLLLNPVREALARGGDLDTLARAFQPWVDFLTRHAAPSEDGVPMLPGTFVDCIPQNLIATADGSLHYFDAEWVLPERIPLSWVYVHGVVNSITQTIQSGNMLAPSLLQLLKMLGERNGLTLSDVDLKQAAEQESRFFERIVAGDTRIDFNAMYNRPLALRQPPQRISLAELNWRSAEIARIKRTVSWRITAPLRAAWNILLAVFSPNRNGRRA